MGLRRVRPAERGRGGERARRAALVRMHHELLACVRRAVNAKHATGSGTGRMTTLRSTVQRPCASTASGWKWTAAVPRPNSLHAAGTLRRPSCRWRRSLKTQGDGGAERRLPPVRRWGFDKSPPNRLLRFGTWDLGIGIFSERLSGSGRGKGDLALASFAAYGVLAAHLKEIEP